MPLALDPQKTHKIVLSSDEDKPADIQPAFIVKYLTGREWLELAELDDQLTTITGSVASGKHSFMMAKKFLIDWENMVEPDGTIIPFDLDKLEDICGLMEVVELGQKILRARPDFLTKNRSASLSESDTA